VAYDPEPVTCALFETDTTRKPRKFRYGRLSRGSAATPLAALRRRSCAGWWLTPQVVCFGKQVGPLSPLRAVDQAAGLSSHAATRAADARAGVQIAERNVCISPCEAMAQHSPKSFLVLLQITVKGLLDCSRQTSPACLTRDCC